MSPRVRAPGRHRVTLDSQPGLPMAIPLAGPPGRVVPEASTPCSGPFDGDEWLFGVDWEGSRCLLIADGDGSVRLQGETAALDARFPEIVAAARLSAPRAMVLDGSVCVLDEHGRPDLAALCGRVAGGLGLPAVAYLVTDLLSLDGQSFTDRPLLVRLAALRDVVPPNSRIQLPDHVVGHGRALAAAAAERGLSAVIARRQDAPYLAGMASPQRLRIPLRGRRDAVVIGWRRATGGVRVVLGDWVLGRLGLVGTSAVDGEVARRWLADTSEPVREPSIDDPDAAGPGVTWLRPRLVAAVEPAPSGREARARVPDWRLVALRDDVDPMWCVRRRPLDPPQASAHEPLRPFSPTVLSALPIGGAA